MNQARFKIKQSGTKRRRLNEMSVAKSASGLNAMEILFPETFFGFTSSSRNPASLGWRDLAGNSLLEVLQSRRK
jgi:hypothetical protein